MKAKHTPGNWKATLYKLNRESRWVIIGGYHEEIICKLGRVNTLVEEEANAHLIAAAPDLLAVLQDIVGLHDRDEAVCDRLYDDIVLGCERSASEIEDILYDDARAAIAKATK